MRDETIGTWLDELASAAPAPGGGAAAAMQAAVGAALVEMVCHLTIGKPRYAEHEATMTAALAEAGVLRGRALALAAEDEVAFSAVTSAYRLDKGPDRTAAIQAALVGAADVPLRTAELAASVIALAERIAAGANVNVLSDVAVAASAARSALEAAVVNVEVNLAALSDPATRAEIGTRLATHIPALAHADALVADVRTRILT